MTSSLIWAYPVPFVCRSTSAARVAVAPSISAFMAKALSSVAEWYRNSSQVSFVAPKREAA